MLRKFLEQKQLLRRAFSSSLYRFNGQNQTPPTPAFKQLVQLSGRLDKTSISSAPPDPLFFYPRYFMFSSLFRPTHAKEAREQIRRLKYERAQQLKIEPKQLHLETLQKIIKPGSFYKINTSNKSGGALIAASDEEVARASTLLGMPIFAYEEKEIIPVLKSYCRLLNIKTIQELDTTIPGGVVVYAIQHERDLEEARTLLYLEHTYFDEELVHPATAFGYEEVFEKFLRPKLFRDENNERKIIKPEEFTAKAITGSYSCRIVDIAMGILTQTLQKEGIDPAPYLSGFYALNLMANPYNFVPKWHSKSDWRKPVLMSPMVDTVWGFQDIATRVLPKVDLFLTLFQMTDNNRICIADGKRQAIIIVPNTNINYHQLVDSDGKTSLHQISATFLGHGLDQAVDALQEQEALFVEGVNAFFRGQITQQQFQKYREKPENTYFYQPTDNIPLRDLVAPTLYMELDPFVLVQNTLNDHYFHWDLYQLLKGEPLNTDPSWLNVRIIKYLEFKVKADFIKQSREDEAELFTLELETTMNYRPLDWLYWGKRMGEEVYTIVRSCLATFNILTRVHEEIVKNTALSSKLLELYNKILSSSSADEALGADKLVSLFNNPEILDVFNHVLAVTFESLKDSSLSSKEYLSAFKLTDLDLLDNTKEIQRLHSFPRNRALIGKYQQPSLRYVAYSWGKKGEPARQFVSQLAVASLPITEVVDAFKPLISILAKAAEDLINSPDINDIYCASISRYYMNTTGIKLRASIAAYYSYLQQYSTLSNPKAKPVALSDSYFRALGRMDPEDKSQKKKRTEKLKEMIEIIRRFPPIPAEHSEEEKLTIFLRYFADAHNVYYDEFISPKKRRAHKEQQIDRFVKSGFSREEIGALLDELDKELEIFIEKIKVKDGQETPYMQRMVMRVQYYIICELIPKPASDDDFYNLVQRELHEMTSIGSTHWEGLPQYKFHEDYGFLDFSSDDDKDLEKPSVRIAGAARSNFRKSF